MIERDLSRAGTEWEVWEARGQLYDAALARLGQGDDNTIADFERAARRFIQALVCYDKSVCGQPGAPIAKIDHHNADQLAVILRA